MSVENPNPPALNGLNVLTKVYEERSGAWKQGQPYPQGMLSFIYHVIFTKEINNMFRNGEPIMTNIFALPPDPDQRAVTVAGNAGTPDKQLITDVVNCIPEQDRVFPFAVQVLVEGLSQQQVYFAAW